MRRAGPGAARSPDDRSPRPGHRDDKAAPDDEVTPGDKAAPDDNKATPAARGRRPLVRTRPGTRAPTTGHPAYRSACAAITSRASCR